MDLGLLVFVMLASLTPLAVIVFFVVLLFRIAVAVLVPSRPPSMPRCGSCGYPTEGLIDERCPECGGAFAKVGIQRHRPLVQRVDKAIRVFFPVVVWMIATVLMLGGIGNVAPRPAVETDTFSMPPSGTYTGVAVTKRGSRPALVSGGPMQPAAMVFEMIDDHAGGGVLTITFPERRWRISSADGVILEQGRGADPASVAALFRIHGVSTEATEVRREITALTTLINLFAMGNHVFPQGPFGGHRSSRIEPGAPSPMTWSLVAWIIGTIIGVRWWKRRRAKAAAES